MTVRRLFEEWDRDNQAGEVSSTQARAYRGYFNNHILPVLGYKRLNSLTRPRSVLGTLMTLSNTINHEGSHSTP